MQAVFVAKYLKQYPSIRSCCIAGFGEPLMNPQLLPIIDTLQSAKIITGLVTNGSFLSKHVPELARRKLVYLSVSLNAATEEEHRAVTATVTWDSVIEGIKAALKAGINAGISFVCSKRNLSRIPAMLQLGLDLGVKFIHLVNILPHGDPDFLTKVITVHNRDALKEIQTAKSLPGAHLVQCWPEPINLVQANPRRCNSPFVSIGVDGKGFVTGCRRVHGPDGKHGHMDCAKLWEEGQHFVELRMALNGDRPLPKSCLLCFGNWKA